MSEFVSRGVSLKVLRGSCCDILLNVRASSEYKIDDVKYRFYMEIENVSDEFPKYYLNIFIGNFSAKAGKKFSE
jgi:hypothetical protein